MSIVSKKKSYEDDSETVIMRALKELEPEWARFKRGLDHYQWAWEYLRRNPQYGIDSAAALRLWDEWEEKQTPKSFKRATKAIKQIHDQYGLDFPLPINAKVNERCWGEHLNGKYWSQAKVKSDYRSGKISINLGANERVMVIDLNTPYQFYQKMVKDMYEELGLDVPLPSLQIKKFPIYLKVHDLRTWGEKNPNAKGKASISWREIGIYLSPRTPFSVQLVRKQYAAAQELIQGGYKKIVKYKT